MKWLACVTLSVASVGLIPAQASAGQFGVQYFEKFCVYIPFKGTECPPTGFMRSTVTGEGLNLEQVRVEFNTSIKRLCNWHAEVVVNDNNGKRMSTHKGPLHESCNNYGKLAVRPGMMPRAGKIIIKLYKDGNPGREVSKQTFSIVPVKRQ